MKKILFLATIVFANVMFAVQLPEDFGASAKAYRVDFVQAQSDSEEALVLVMPGFNVKPSKLNFVLEAFAQKGIPGLLFNFSGCAEGESCEQMTCDNWQSDALKAIGFTIVKAEELNRKVIIVGHSMGGLYALRTLGQMERGNYLTENMKKRIKLALIAPADGLKSIRGIVTQLAPPAAFILPQINDNCQLITTLESNTLLAGLISAIPLGQMICGDNAAQNNLPISAFKGLVAPCADLVYPNIESQVFFYENDGLMNAAHYPTYEAIFPTCKVNSLGFAENEITAHTFEHLIGTPDLGALLVDPILAMMKAKTQGEGEPISESVD